MSLPPPWLKTYNGILADGLIIPTTFKKKFKLSLRTMTNIKNLNQNIPEKATIGHCNKHETYTEKLTQQQSRPLTPRILQLAASQQTLISFLHLLEASNLILGRGSVRMSAR